MEKSERIIHLDDMLIYILKKWKIFMMIMILSGIVFGSVGIYKVNEKYKASKKTENSSKVAVTVSEEEANSVNTLLYLEKMISEQREYNNNSILMKIDPYDKKVASIRYQFQVIGDTIPELQESRLEQGKKTYQCVFNNEEIYDFIKSSLSIDTEVKYLKELISIEMDSKGVIVINAIAPDEEMAQKIQEAVEKYFSLNEKKILSNYKDLSVKLDSKYIVSTVDTGLQGIQSTQYNNPQTLQAQIDSQYALLSDHAKQYLALARTPYQEGHYESGQVLYKEVNSNEEVSLKRKLYESGIYAIKRMIVLVGLFAAYLALKYMWSPKLVYAYDMRDMFGIHVVDILSANDDDRIKLTVERIFSFVSGADGVVLITSIREEKLLKVLESLKGCLEDKKIDVHIMAEPGNDDLLQLMRTSYDVIMIEGIGVSRYGKIKEILRDMRNLSKNVKGALVIKDILGNKGL